MGRKAKIRQLRKKSVANESDIGAEIVKKALSEMPAAYKGTIENLQERGLSSPNVVIEPPGEDQMSEIMLRFIEPLVNSLEQKYEILKGQIISLAVLAWNGSLLKPGKRKRMIYDALDETFKLKEQKDREKMVDFMNFMVKVKEEDYSEYRRFILDYKVKKQGDKLKIDVTSIDFPNEGDQLNIYVSSMD